MLRGKVVATTLSAVVALTAAACGSSSTSKPAGGSTPSTGSGTASATKATVTIGVLTDVTGLASASDKQVTDGVKAGIVAAARDGYRIKYVLADTASNPAQVSTAAQKLVSQDHVTAVISNTALLFAAAPFLTRMGIPVIGAAQDGPEWTTSKNMFSVFGALNAHKVTDIYGKIYQKLGATKVGAIGYGISPVSKLAAEGAAASAESVGLKVPYLNANFAFGSTDVQPIALAMKSAGVEGFQSATTSATTFSLVAALRNLGVDIKAPLMSTGYGGELLTAGTATQQAAKGVYFLVAYEPMEMNTAATKRFAADLKAAGVTEPPGYAMYNGYASVLMLVQALKAAGANPSRASVLTALSGIHRIHRRRPVRRSQARPEQPDRLRDRGRQLPVAHPFRRYEVRTRQRRRPDLWPAGSRQDGVLIDSQPKELGAATHARTTRGQGHVHHRSRPRPGAGSRGQAGRRGREDHRRRHLQGHRVQSRTRCPATTTSWRPRAWSKRPAASVLPSRPTCVRREQLAAALAEGLSEFGRLTTVCANAGILPMAMGDPQPLDFQDAIDVDLIGVMNTVAVSVPHLLPGRAARARSSSPGRPRR